MFFLKLFEEKVMNKCLLTHNGRPMVCVYILLYIVTPLGLIYRLSQLHFHRGLIDDVGFMAEGW